MNKSELSLRLETLSKLIDVPLEEIVVGGRAVFVLKDFLSTTNDLNVFVPEKYLERIALNEGTYFPKGSSRQTVAQWFVPIAVRNVTAWIRPANNFYGTEIIEAPIIKYHESHGRKESVIKVTVLDNLSMLIEKRASYSTVKRSKVKREQDFEDIQILQGLMARHSHERIRKAS